MKLTHPKSTRVIEVAESVAHRYMSQGWRPATPAAPKGNAPKAEWVEFALTQGMTEDDVDGLTRDELREALS